MSEVVEPQELIEVMDVIDAAEEKWGIEFDDKNTLNDWAASIVIYTARAVGCANKDDTEAQYDALIDVAGLALTAAARVRLGTVKSRHYDEKA